MILAILATLTDTASDPDTWSNIRELFGVAAIAVATYYSQRARLDRAAAQRRTRKPRKPKSALPA